MILRWLFRPSASYCSCQASFAPDRNGNRLLSDSSENSFDSSYRLPLSWVCLAFFSKCWKWLAHARSYKQAFSLTGWYTHADVPLPWGKVFQIPLIRAFQKTREAGNARTKDRWCWSFPLSVATLAVLLLLWDVLFFLSEFWVGRLSWTFEVVIMYTCLVENRLRECSRRDFTFSKWERTRAQVEVISTVEK